MAPGSPKARRKILLASANAPLRRRIRKVLAGNGLRSREVRDAASLLAFVGRLQPDLVLVDLDLAGIDLRALRAACGSTPVLAITSPGKAARAIEAGATDCIVTPLHAGMIVHRVRRELEQGETLGALERGRERIADLAGKLAGMRVNGGRSRQAVERDDLTGLPRREEILKLLADAIAAARAARGPVAVLHVDLDLVRALPLLSGPEQRDRTIAAMAQRLRECVRDRDTVGHLGSRMREVSLARLGGEEFCLLLPGLARPQDAYKVACRIQDTLSRRLPFDGADLSTASSFGIAIWPSDGATSEAILDAAQAACRAARAQERGGIRFFTAEINASAVERLRLELGLRRALECDELVVHYQPRIDLASGRICGFEALVRWMHPDLGLVAPGRFIPIAEETGLIVPIGERVLRLACAQNRAWQKQGLPSVRMGVNISSVQFREPELPEGVAAVLEETGLAPEWLELELTESVLMHKAEATLSHLHRLEGMGLRLSIDDFGTGYSSLSYLKRFPIAALKIDQSFIREVTTNPEDAAITTSIVLMGKSLDLDVVAEGVETRSQHSFLRVIECDEAQGFLFSPPVPAFEAGILLAQGLPADLAA